MTDATRAKISAAKLGHAVSAETRAKIALALLGRSPSSETRAKLSVARKGHAVSTETRAKISAGNTGRTRSAETKAKLSLAFTGRSRKPFTAETKARMSAAKAGRKHSPEHRAKHAAALRGRKQSPEHVARRMVTQTGRRHSDETRAKLSARAVEGLATGRRVIPASRRYTKLAQALHRYLSSRGFTVTPEVRFGRYTVDLYDAERHIAHEADGQHWHAKNEAARPGYHERRDTYLRETHGLPVLRYTDTEIAYLEL